MRHVRRLARDRRGSVVVETAFVLPVLALLLFGTMETGRIVWTQQAMNYAVQEAARCALVNASACAAPAQTAAFAAARAPATGLTAANFTVQMAGAQPGCRVWIEAKVPYKFLVWGPFPSAPVLDAQVCRN